MNANFGKKFPPEPITADEFKALLALCPSRWHGPSRNAACMTLLFRGGLRVSEALALMPHDLDRVAGTVHVRHGKGDKSRLVAMDPESWALLEPWDRHRPDGKFTVLPESPYICTTTGHRLLPRGLRYTLHSLARRAGLRKRVTPHQFRHGFAVSLLNENINLGIISNAMGHASPSVTDHYLRCVNPKQVIETLRARTL